MKNLVILFYLILLPGVMYIIHKTDLLNTVTGEYLSYSVTLVLTGILIGIFVLLLRWLYCQYDACKKSLFRDIIGFEFAGGLCGGALGILISWLYYLITTNMLWGSLPLACQSAFSFWLLLIGTIIGGGFALYDYDYEDEIVYKKQETTE